MVRNSRSNTPPARRDATDGRRRGLFLLLCVLALLASAGYLAWFGWRWSRPGTQHYLKGLDFLASGHPNRAEAEWILGVKQAPSDYRSYEELGDYYASIHRTADAAACYANATRLHPGDATLFMRLSRAHQDLGDFKGAARAAYDAAALQPDNARMVGTYGILEAKLKERRTAIAALTRACLLDPKNGQFLLARALAEMDSLDFPAADADLRTYLRSHPRDPEASYYLCVLYNQKPRTPENVRAAIALAQAALAGLPGETRVYNALGQLYLDSGRPRDALAVFLAGLKRSGNDEGILHGLADTYHQLGMKANEIEADHELQIVGDRHEQIAHLKHVMGFNHFDLESGLKLARLEELDGDDRLAVTYYQQIVRQWPKDMRARRLLSNYYRRIGRPDLAATALRTDMVP
ncbi:MAG: tetratricopeptide repeat protein [Chloroflexi bacterium]|nr:tetratricopeptide repeat protein [Chloroflexota bacterium]